jgi:hypothetical protein
MATATSFRPTNTFRDMIREWDDDDSFVLRQEQCVEVELLPHLTPQDVLATAGIAWGDSCRFFRRKIVWMTPEVYVCTGDNNFAAVFPMVLSLGANTHLGPRLCVHVVPDTPAGAATETCDCAIRLLATCFLHDVSIEGDDIAVAPPLSGPGLSLFFQESRSCLRKVSLRNMALSEDLCHALATMARFDVELNVGYCSLSDDAAGSFGECLHSDRGPVELINCEIDSQILASALAGQSRVTRLGPAFEFERTADAETAVLFRALTNNRGLLELDVQYCSISDENWSVLCESLRVHPTLTILNLIDTGPRSTAGAAIGLSGEQTANRIRLLAEMVQLNTVLHTIQLSEGQYDQQFYDEMMHPYLETNRYRPRVHAITKADISLRRPLLGLALLTESVRNTSNLLWMFLSGNPDVVLQSNADGEQVVDIAARAPAEVAASVPVEVAASGPVEIAASGPVEIAATRKQQH